MFSPKVCESQRQNQYFTNYWDYGGKTGACTTNFLGSKLITWFIW